MELSKEDGIVTYYKIDLLGYEAAGILEGAGLENVKVMEGDCPNHLRVKIRQIGFVNTKVDRPC